MEHDQEDEHQCTLADRAIANDADRYFALQIRRMPDEEGKEDQVEQHPELVVGPTGYVGRVYEDSSDRILRVVTSTEWVAVLGPWGRGKAHYFWSTRSNDAQWKIPADLEHHAATFQ